MDEAQYRAFNWWQVLITIEREELVNCIQVFYGLSLRASLTQIIFNLSGHLGFFSKGHISAVWKDTGLELRI